MTTLEYVMDEAQAAAEQEKELSNEMPNSNVKFFGGSSDINQFSKEAGNAQAQNQYLTNEAMQTSSQLAPLTAQENAIKNLGDAINQAFVACSNNMGR
jgi:hypothetical protein